MKSITLSKDDQGKLIAIVAILFGGWLRILPAMLADFPINDGGLFYVMLQSLIQNGFKLPEYISYNGLSIPFAYPPLAFYLGAWISNAFNIDLLVLLRWMPGLVTAISVVAFYDLARTLLKSDLEAGVATLIFAFTPRAMTWFVMGGGLTRSLGEVFLILAIRFVYSLFSEDKQKNLFLAILFCSLVVITHPEATIHTIIACLLLWIFYGSGKKGVARAFSVAIGVIILTIPWWMTVLVRYGLSPFFSAAQTGDQSLLVLISNLFISVSEEPYLTTIAVLGALGLIIKIFQREYFLPAFYLLPLVLEPRNAANVVIIPLAMLAAISINQMVLKTLGNITLSISNKSHSIQKFGYPIIIFVFYTSLLINAGYFGLQLSKHQLNPGTLDAFTWVKNYTKPDSSFIILTGETDSFCDSVQEWFPVLANRVSHTTPQGKEWIPGDSFSEFRKYLTTLQRCTNNNISCVENILVERNIEFDYLFIQRTGTSKLFCVPRGDALRGGNLIHSIDTSNSNYSKVFSSNDVEIYVIENQLRQNPK